MSEHRSAGQRSHPGRPFGGTSTGTTGTTGSLRSSGERCSDGDPPLVTGAGLIPGYTVIGLLNRSPSVDVYEVWSSDRACRCVAKTARRSRPDSDRLVTRLLTEGRYLQSFTHPHLVRGYETIDVPIATVILEPVPGRTLSYLIDTVRRPMAARSLVHLGLHLCSAIQYLHRHDVLHLDLKPSNVVCTHGIAKVLDLSLARPPGTVPPGCGTPGYLPPEQARGGAVTTSADVWGIGSVLCEAATGRRAFEPEDDHERYPQLTGRARSVRSRRPRLPRPLASVIDACLEPDPRGRPGLAEVAATLTGLVPESAPPRRAPSQQEPAASPAQGNGGA